MALQPGTRLGPYEVLSLIGAGGMGEVYRGRDTRLDRSVALKILAPTLAPDADFRARFTREARAVSALNHPHICGLYDVGREHDTDYLVLELLDGETLQARLQGGALPLNDVLRFGVEIAGALAAAHLHGIVHRDLKPGNVLITRGGTKLLDFGLAKAIQPAGAAGDTLTTITGSPTAAGMMIGTLQYMAPEQVTGETADARTDIFALGALLHEMATGRRAFEAATQAGLVAKILSSEVPAVSTLAAWAPAALDYLVQGCLAKEPADRWQAAHDVALQLQWIQSQSSRPDVAAALARRAWMPWGVAALAAGLFLTTVLLPFSRRAPVEQVLARLEITLPSHMRLLDRGEISPDGRHIVVVASVRSRWQLVIRDLASGQVIERDDTERAVFPFWSRDSQSIGFFADRKLKRIAVSGGPATVLADAKEFTGQRGGATWASGVILFPSSDGAILQVAEGGGTPTVVATLPWVAGKRAFGWPRFLPDGRRFLVTQVDDPALYLASLDTPGMHKLPQDGSQAVYAAGHLLFLRGVGAYARPFDAARVEFTGREVLLAERAGFLSASDTGTVLYRADRQAPSRLSWFDRRGRQTATVGEAEEYAQVVLAAKGNRAVVVQLDTHGAEGDNDDLWDVDLATGIFSKLTTNPALDTDPSWSPDERHVAFTSSRTGVAAVYVKDIITGAEDPLVVLKENVYVDQWTPDGKFVIFRNLGRAVWSVAVSGDRTPKMLIDTPQYVKDEVHVSPNGHWVAFNANESGVWEVYVARFPDFMAKHQISGHGGVQPQWSGNGRELFYLALDGSLMGVPVNAEAGPVVSEQSRFFPTPFEPTPHEPQYAVTADGARFLGLAQVAGDRSSLTVLLNALPNISGASAR